MANYTISLREYGIIRKGLFNILGNEDIAAAKLPDLTLIFKKDFNSTINIGDTLKWNQFIREQEVKS